MTVLARSNDLQISVLKFQTKIAEKEGKALKFYSNTLYPFLFDIDTDPAKAFFFDTGSGSVQTQTAFTGMRNRKATASPTAPHADATLKVIGWYVNDTLGKIYFLGCSNGTTNGVDYKLFIYDIATENVTTINVYSHGTVVAAVDVPNENSMFVSGSTLYFAYNKTTSGVIATHTMGGAATVTDVCEFTCARTDYEQATIKNIALIGDFIAVVGNIDDTDGANNTFGFLYVIELASLPGGGVAIDGSVAHVYVSDDYLPSAAVTLEVGSVCGKDDTESGGKLSGVVFANYKLNLGSVLTIAVTWDYDVTDGDIDMRNLTLLDTAANGVPGQCKLLERPGSDKIFFADRDGASTRSFKYLLRKPGAQTSGAVGYIYNSLAIDDNINAGPISTQDFGLSLKFHFVNPSASLDLLSFFNGDLTTPGLNTAKLALNSGSIEFWITDGTSLVLAASTAAVTISEGVLHTVTVTRSKYNEWAITFDGVDKTVTAGDAATMPFGSGNYVELYGAASEITCYGEFDLIFGTSTILYRGVPGSQALIGGYFEDILDCFIVEDQTAYGYSYQGYSGGFDVHDIDADNVDLWFCRNSTSDANIARMTYDFSAGTITYHTGGDCGGLTTPRALAPCWSEDDECLYPIFGASTSPGTAARIFHIARMSEDVSFDINEAAITVQFDTADSSIVSGTMQSDSLIFSDNASVYADSTLPLTGYPYTLSLTSTVPYALIVMGEGHVDFLRKASTPTTVSLTVYQQWRGEAVTRYSYSYASGAFYTDASGPYIASAKTGIELQDTSEDFTAYFDTANITLSSILEEVKQSAIGVFIKLAVSTMKAMIYWSSDTNYKMNTEGRYENCGSAVETARLHDGGSTAYSTYYGGSKQIEIKELQISQRIARSFKVRVAATVTDSSSAKQYDDFKVFHMTIKADPSFTIDGDDTNASS